jgi:hypothetical protein
MNAAQVFNVEVMVDCVAQGSFNMCLRHMGFRPTKGARYGGKYDIASLSSIIFSPSFP